MAKNPNRNFNVKVAAPSRKSKFHLPKTHVCTSDFGVLKSIDCRLYVPGDDFKFKVSQFTRLMPMPVPTYGDIKSITRCFVTPINTVMNNFDDFITKNFTRGEAGSTSLYPAAVPYILSSNIVKLFYDLDSTFQPNEFSSEVVDLGQDPQPPGVSYDAVITAENGSYVGVRFSNLGRRVVSWLHGLGLNWNWSILSQFEHRISALPILCWWKFYLDWIVPSRFRNEFVFVNNMLGVNYTQGNANIFVDFFNSNYSQLRKLFTPVSCYYSDDYFTTGFKNPYGLEQDAPYDSYNYNVSGQVGYDGDFSSAHVPTSTTIYADTSPRLDTETSEGMNMINYFSLQSLAVLQDMVNRGKLAGSKIQDYLLTTYGIRPDDDVLHLSKYLGAHRNTIQIGDIKATATTDSSLGSTYLGQFAGTASGGNVDTFEFGNYEEHCYIFITNELSIKPSYTQGTHIEFNALEPYQFYDPNWDGIGSVAVPFKELCNDFDFSQGVDSLDVPKPNDVFCFKPTYSEFKESFDIISGDFRCGTLNTGLDSWFLNRQINKSYLDNVGRFINRKFCEQVSDSNNYDRIFQIANNNSDHFYSIFVIDCTAYRHMISVEDSLETESKDDGEGHKEVKVDFQGTVNN